MLPARVFTCISSVAASLALGCSHVQPAPKKPPSVTLVFRTVVHTRQLYFDHSRIEPRRMLVAGIKAVASVAPGLDVDATDPASLTLSSRSHSRVFDLRDAGSFWGADALFRAMHGYLTGSLGIPDGDRQIGFAAANGMLSTLDPGCALVSEVEFLTRRTVSEDVPLSSLLAIGSLGADVTYLRLAGLPVGTATVVGRLLGARSRFGGMILDLRGNSVGLFQEAVRVANLFMETGLRMEFRVGAQLGATGQMRNARTIWHGPLVILADDRTASGAEIIVAVLKDLDRAVVFGARTAGVGTMQASMVDTDPDDGRKAYLELTVGTFKRPSGVGIDGLGIAPDLSFVRTDLAGHAEQATHLGVPSLNPFAAPAGPSDSPERSIAEVSYVWQAPADRSTPQEFLLQDPEIRLARELLVRAPKSHRSEMLEELKRLAKETPSAPKSQ